MIGLLRKRRTSENKICSVRYNKINITFPARVIVENIIARNIIINLGCASVDNHIPREDIFYYHPHRECNIYIILNDQESLKGCKGHFNSMSVFAQFASNQT